MLEKFFKNSTRPKIPEHYEIIYSHRKTLAIQIKSPDLVIIRAPHFCENIFIENFVNAKKSWIETHLSKMREKNFPQKFSDVEILQMKKNLEKYIFPKVAEIWKKTDFPPYKSVKITKSETHWGSCSSQNRLNFSYRLAEFLGGKEDFIDAVIIHELCHLVEKNHQKPFWNLVKKFCPEYFEIMKKY